MVSDVFQQNQLAFGGRMHVFTPLNNEIDLILANIFPTPSCEGPYFDLSSSIRTNPNDIGQLHEINEMPRHRMRHILKFLQYLNPITAVNLIIQQNEIISSSVSFEDMSTDWIERRLNSICKCVISVVLSSELYCNEPYSPRDEIALLTLDLILNEKHFILHLLNKQIMSPDTSAKPHVKVVPLENERTLLQYFIELYCKNTIFLQMDVRGVHFLVGRSNVNAVSMLLMDRMFYNNLGEHFHEFIAFTDDIVLLNHHAVILDTLVSSNTIVLKTNGLFIQPFELPSCANARTPTKHLKKKLKLSSTWTYLTTDHILERVEKSIRDAFNVNCVTLLKDSLFYANDLKLPLREMYSCSPTKLASHALFLYHLKHEVLLVKSSFVSNTPPLLIDLLPSMNIKSLETYEQHSETTNFFTLSPDALNMAMKCKKLPVLQQYEKSLKPFTAMSGGWWAGELGIYSNDGPYVCLDFKAFYPSIVASFNLDFHNHCLMTCNELQWFRDQLSTMYQLTAIDELFFILDLYAPPPHCRLVKLSQVPAAKVCVYLVVFLHKRNLLGKMMLERITVTMTDNQRRTAKRLNNSLIGCLGNIAFPYHSESLMLCIHALGQFIMSLVCAFLAQRDERVIEQLYLMRDTGVLVDVLKVSTDSIIVRDSSGADLKSLVENFLSSFFQRFHLTNHLLIKTEFQTNLLVIHTKSNFFYYDSCWRGSTNCPTDVLEKIRRREPLTEKSDFRNFRLALVYMYSYCQRYDVPANFLKYLYDVQQKRVQITLDANINNKNSYLYFFLNTVKDKRQIIENDSLTHDLEFLLNALRAACVE